MISAFGVEHGDQVSKLDWGGKKPSAGRRVLASAPYTGLVHPFVAGKSGKKLRAGGNQLGGGLAGGMGGSLAGSILGGVAGRGSPAARGLGASLGSVGGLVGGSQAGLARNTRKGYLKRES